MNRLQLLSIAALASCSVQATEITAWAWDPNFNVAALKEAASVYQKDHPDFTLNVIASGKEDVEQKLHTMLASGVTSALPDIVLIEDYNAQKYLNAYPGSFQAMQSVVDYRQFAPYKVEVMTVGKDVYGLPFDSGVAGLFYRRDLLKQAGISADDLQSISWDEYIDIGKKVKQTTGKYMMGFDIQDTVFIHILMQSGGEWFFNHDGSLNILHNKALKEALKTVKAIHDAKIVRPVSGWSDFVGSFNSGKVASVTSGVWMIGSVKSEASQSGQWGVAPIPKLNLANSVHASNQGGSSWYVLSAGKQPQLAIDFLDKTFGGDVDMYQKLLVERGALSTYLPAKTGKAYQVDDAFFGGQKVYGDFSKWVAQIPKVPYGMYTQEVDNALSALIPSLLSGTPVDEILESLNNNLKYQIQ
ncbi:MULTISPECIES: ABC transporter substrate-binding protein [unclassified Agarivorans]|uniref:ABC transporter substrate-binding protein n=1 Tax=unclassified Agarivorans TaxID=2636026 RepID=UPI003D7C7D3C